MSGFIKLHRGWQDSDLFRDNEPFCERMAWLWIVEHAAWKDTIRYSHKGEMIEVSRGQLHTSLSAMESSFSWSKKKVRGFLDRLEKRHMVVAKRAQSGTLLTVCNYAKYQDRQDTEGHGQGTVGDTVGAQLGHTQEEEIRKDKKNKNNIPAQKGKKIPFPEGFKPNPSPATKTHRLMAAWTEQKLEHELEAFENYWRRRGDLMANWDSCWSTWVLNNDKFSNPEKPDPWKNLEFNHA